MRMAEAGSRLRARGRRRHPSSTPAGLSFASAGIMDAIKAFEGPVREVTDVVARLERILELLKTDQQAA